MPVEVELLPGLNLFRDVQTVSPPVGVLEAENGAHDTFIGVTAESLKAIRLATCSSGYGNTHAGQLLFVDLRKQEGQWSP
jgi:hypothetical protein